MNTEAPATPEATAAPSAAAVPRRVFITGALGFLGRRIGEAFRASGAQVSGMDVRDDPGLGVVAGDTRRPGAWQDAFAGADLAGGGSRRGHAALRGVAAGRGAPAVAATTGRPAVSEVDHLTMDFRRVPSGHLNPL